MNIVYVIAISLTVISCCRKTPAAASVSKDTHFATGDTATTAATEKIPACILQRIDSLKREPVQNPPARVEEYLFEGMRVFVFSAPCCDFFANAFDEHCSYICAPSGGFTGRGDGQCPTFAKEAKLVRVVWKDERKK